MERPGNGKVPRRRYLNARVHEEKVEQAVPIRIVSAVGMRRSEMAGPSEHDGFRGYTSRDGLGLRGHRGPAEDRGRESRHHEDGDKNSNPYPQPGARATHQEGISRRGSEFPERCQRPYSPAAFFRPRVEGTLGLLPYAARDVLRNRRRSISSILGVLLAVTFVAGTFIAIDSSARATLDASLAGIPGDFSFSIYTFGPNRVNYSTLEQAV